MNSITYIKCLFTVALLSVACSKVDSSESSFDADSLPITFSTGKTQLSATSKAGETTAQGETDFGSYSVSTCSRGAATSRVNSSGFEESDQIGIYLYYNYWFDEYAESTILDDATLTIGSTSNSLDPQKLWTFSSLGGNVPTSLHTQAYYPKAAGVEFTYGSGSHLEWEHDSTVDLLIASNVYGWWHYTSDQYATNLGALFKVYITETLGGKVDLSFEHQLATLSFYIYKASDIDEELTIKSLKVNYTCAESFDSSTDSSWSATTVTKESILTVKSGGTLSVLSTTEPITPLTLDSDIFLPPSTVINSIAFSFDGDNGDYAYTWHPHIVDMEVMEYQITFELDPDRNN